MSVTIGFISDIHGNLPSLEFALRYFVTAGCKRIYCAGDVIGKGPYPGEVIDLLMEREIPCIRGNVERVILRYRPSKGSYTKKTGKKANLTWTAKRLSKKHWRWIENLPDSLELTVEKTNILIVHGSPRADTDPIYPSITESGLQGRMKQPADLLICGHSHIPFSAKVKDTHIVNCGACGYSIDGDNRGALAMVTIAKKGIQSAVIHRFEYPTKDIVRSLKLRGVPKTNKSIYLEGSRRDYSR